MGTKTEEVQEGNLDGGWESGQHYGTRLRLTRSGRWHLLCFRAVRSHPGTQNREPRVRLIARSSLPSEEEQKHPRCPPSQKPIQSLQLECSYSFPLSSCVPWVSSAQQRRLFKPNRKPFSLPLSNSYRQHPGRAAVA